MVSNATTDLDWARQVFGFEWGRSTFPERFAALLETFGSLNALARAAELPSSTLKSWGIRGNTPKADALGRLSQLTRLSVSYLASGEVETPADFDAEKMRFEAARAGFMMSSSPARRDARRTVIAEAAAAMERDRARVMGIALPPTTPGGFGHRELERLTLVPAIGIRHGLAITTERDPGPMAFETRWLRSIGLEPGDLGLFSHHGDQMTPTIPDGATLLVDLRESQQLLPGLVYFFVVAGVPLVRRYNRRVDGKVELICDNPKYAREVLEPEELTASSQMPRHVVWVSHIL